MFVLRSKPTAGPKGPHSTAAGHRRSTYLRKYQAIRPPFRSIHEWGVVRKCDSHSERLDGARFNIESLARSHFFLMYSSLDLSKSHRARHVLCMEQRPHGGVKFMSQKYNSLGSRDDPNHAIRGRNSRKSNGWPNLDRGSIVSSNKSSGFRIVVLRAIPSSIRRPRVEGRSHCESYYDARVPQ